MLLIWRRSLCAVSGAIVGGLSGMIMGFVLAPPATPALSLPDVVRASLVLGILGWIVLLVVIGAWLHYGFSQIALPALVNALITAFLTVFFCNKIHVAVICTVLGLVIGTLVGWLLCIACQRWAGTKGGSR
jgi:hypothetical protein